MRRIFMINGQSYSVHIKSIDERVNMQVANRGNRRYIPSSVKTSKENIVSTSKKQSNAPQTSHISPKKNVDIPVTKPNQEPTLKKLIDRFRYQEPQPRPERESTNSDFWWLHEELKTNCVSDDETNDERKSNIPEFIEIFPSTDIDQDLNRRASLLLNQTFSAHSSDMGQVSTTGIGSIPSTTMTTTTTSIFQPVVYEQPARPIFTRPIDSKYDMKTDSGEGDILYQWRLRRRLEQAQHGEPIVFPSKITSRTKISPVRSHIPSGPIEVPTVRLQSASPALTSKTTSPKRERQASSVASTEVEHVKITNTNAPPVRQCVEMATQTLQDACIQTSQIIDTGHSSMNEIDLQPTRDYDHQNSSVWHRPPPKSKTEITRRSSSPSPTKRSNHTFRPIVVSGNPISNHTSHHRSVTYPSNPIQSSHDSTLTQVTSIMINDHNNFDNSCPMKINNSLTLMDEIHEEQQNDDVNDHIDYADDEILIMLIEKRDEFLIALREIEQNLANKSS